MFLDFPVFPGNITLERLHSNGEFNDLSESREVLCSTLILYVGGKRIERGSCMQI